MRIFKSCISKIVLFFVCTVMALCSLSGCRGSSGSKNINWLLDSAPRNLDPQTASLDSELLIIKNCFTPLFEKDETGNLISSIVTKYEVSQDGLQYFFHLNKDNVWSIYRDKKAEVFAPVTAHDFEFAIKRIFTDNPNSDVMQVLGDIKNADKVLSGADISKLGVSCSDDYTLVIRLKKKNPALLETFTRPQLFPCNEEFFRSTSGRYGLSGELLIFNGSFCLSAWGESSVRLVKNLLAPSKTIADGVTLYLPKDSRETVALLKDGSIDAAILPADKMNSLSNKSDFSVTKRTSVVWAMVFNKNDPLWKNASLRMSAILCTDRSALSDKFGEHLTPAYRIVPDTAVVQSQNYSSLTSEISAPQYSAERAKALYTAALIELEKSQIYNTPVLIPDSASCSNSFSALNQIFQRELSLYFSMQALQEQELLTKIKNNDFSAAVVPLYITSDSPSSVLEYFSESSALCIMPITDSNFTKNLLSARSLSDAASASKALGSAEQALYDSTLVNPLFFENSYFVSLPSVSGFETDSYGTVLFKNVVKKS